MMRWLSHDRLEGLWAGILKSAATAGLRLLLILVVYWLARQALFRLVDAGLTRLRPREALDATAEERRRRLMTLQTLVKSLVGYVLFFVMILTALQTLGVNITGIVTTAGVAGIAVGFGAQKLVRDIISGFFIVTEDQFAVGDYVTIGQATGVVEEMGLRTTRVRDDRGRLWAIANGDIGFVLNQSRGDTAASIDLPIPATSDLDDVTRLIGDTGRQLLDEHPAVFTRAPAVEGVTAFDASTVTLRIGVAAPPTVASQAEMLVRARLRAALMDAGILPRPTS